MATSTIKNRVKMQVSKISNKQIIRDAITTILKTHFANTLAQANDCVNLIMAQFFLESSFNTNAISIDYGPSHLRRLLTYSAVAAKYRTGTAEERANIVDSNAAYGLGQCTGNYLIRGAGPSGKGELERIRPDICGPLLVNPGEDIRAKLLGDANINNAILAGLIVLEDKYKSGALKLVQSGRFTNRLQAAQALYLGLGTDGNGFTAEKYIAGIQKYYYAVNGFKFGTTPQNGILAASTNPLVAPGTTSSAGTTTVSNPSPKSSAPGPNSTAASGKNLSVAGCAA